MTTEIERSEKMRVLNIQRCAADQVKQEGRLCNLGCTVSCGNCDYMPAPSDQPADAVVVPMELLRQLRHYTECHRMVFKDCGAPTQSEVDAMLRAAQEGK